MCKRYAILRMGPSFIVLSLFLISYPEARAQKEQLQLQHEVKVTLKLIQVYVTDKKGNPILDLGKNHFVVYDNGEKQSLTEFEKHVLSLPSEKNEVQGEEMIETRASPARELLPRQFFLFFDFAFNNAIGLEKTKQAALHFIDSQLQPTDEVGVLSYSATKSLKLHEYLMTDHRKVRDIVQAFGMKEIAGRAEDFEAKYWSLLKEENPKDASSSGYVFDPDEQRKKELGFLRNQREEAKLQTYNFVRKMTDLAKALRYVPGHKSIIFFSSGVPYSVLTGIPAPEIDPSRIRGFVPKDKSSQDSLTWGMENTDQPERFGTSHLSSRYEDMLKELSAANCAIYALDTQELSSTLTSDVQTRGVFTLQKMTSATGGKYFGNINNYEKHIEKIQDLTGCYYVVGYYVDDKWDGAYHKIKVEVTKPGCEVHAQKGYFNPKPFKEYNGLERMLHLVDLALSEEPLFQTPVRLPSEVFSYSSEGEADLCFISKMEAEKLREVAAGKLEVISVVFDKEGNIVKMHREEKTSKDIPEEDSYYYSFFSLPPGNYACRLVIRNLETGRGAVASSAAVIGNKRLIGIHLFPPLLLTPKKNAKYIRGNIPKPLVEKSPGFSLANFFHFDISQYSPHLEDFVLANTLVPALLRCSLANLPTAEVGISATLTDKLSGKTTPLTLIVLSEELIEEEKRLLVNIHIPELPAGEYALNFTATEKTSKSESTTTRLLKIR
jgi:VWFA-related protein